MRYIVLCHRDNKNILVLDIANQNITYVFASQGVHVASLKLYSQ